MSLAAGPTPKSFHSVFINACWLVGFFSPVTKYLEHSFGDMGFISAHGLKGLTPWLLATVLLGPGEGKVQGAYSRVKLLTSR